MATAFGGIPIHDVGKMKVVILVVEVEGKATVPVVAGMVGIMIARGVALGRGVVVVVAIVLGVATHDLGVKTLWVSAIGYDVGVCY